VFRLQPADVELLTHESGDGAAPDQTAPASGTTGPAPELVTANEREAHHAEPGRL
jgi:hypothetical protein